MIVTNTQSSSGQRRVYLGGKGSVECWIEPKADGIAWIFRLDNAVAGVQLTSTEQHQWAVHTLLQLARELGVSADELRGVPFECIASLHQSDPFSGRRVASGKRKVVEHGFMATAPNVSRPRSDFSAHDFPQSRQRAR